MHPVLAEGAAWPLGWLFLAMGAWRLQPLPCSGEETSTVSPTPSRTSLGSSPLGLRLLHRFSALGPLMHPSGLAQRGPLQPLPACPCCATLAVTQGRAVLLLSQGRRVFPWRRCLRAWARWWRGSQSCGAPEPHALEIV